MRSKKGTIHRASPGLGVGAGLVIAFVGSTASAQPIAPTAFCDAYPSAPACVGGLPQCTLCHESEGATVRNVFGAQVESILWDGDNAMIPAAEFEAGLPEALIAVEELDADGDSYPNFDEWMAGSMPGDADSIPGQDVCGGNPDKSAWRYDVCDYDPAYVYRKVMLDFCGHSPTYDELRDVVDDADPVQRVHDQLDACLTSEFWRGRDGVLWQLAHRKIQPIMAIKSGDDEGGVPLADFEDDYNLFVWTQTDGHDARDLLLADYHVSRDDGPPTTYAVMSEIQQVARPRNQRQLTPVERRAGLVTTRWFMVTNTMFTAIPRTTAAQAYRSYLGLDIAKMQGLVEPPQSWELIDHDSKGITDPVCATCHRTLDALTYPFTTYEGLGGAPSGPGSYNADRMSYFVDASQPYVDQTPEAGYLLGEPVDDLMQWAEVAANSDEFAAATVRDYWVRMIGEEPRPTETESFYQLWLHFAVTHEYSVDAMLHDLIDTEAYSVP